MSPVTKKWRYNPGWAEDRPWLRCDCEQELMFCAWCRDHDINPERNQFAKGCSSMRVKSIKKHEISIRHKNCESANLACKRPDQAPRAFIYEHGKRTAR